MVGRGGLEPSVSRGVIWNVLIWTRSPTGVPQSYPAPELRVESHMKGYVLAAVLVLTACNGTSQPTAFSSPSAVATASHASQPSVQPSAPATAAPSATFPPSTSPSPGEAITLSCRLPVISPTTGTDPPGGWINFPSGQFERDPASSPGRLTAHVPGYDRAIGRWVPVESNNVAPDGATFILHSDSSLPTNGFYIVDARIGTRRLLLSTDGPPQAPGSWTVVRYTSEGVYLWSVGILTVPGLWLLDPLTGTVRLVDGSHYWGKVDGGFAWALDPPFGGATGSTYTVYRLDLTTGQVRTWYQSSTAISLLSPTQGGAMLITYGATGAAQLGLIPAPSQLVPLGAPDRIYVGTDGYLASPGVWIPLQPGGLALYVEGQGVTIMTSSPPIFTIAGDCQ